MSLFGDIASVGAAPFTGGASLAYLRGGGNGPSAQSPVTRNPLQAKDVTITPDLASIFSGIGTNTKNAIGANYGDLAAGQASDAAARGLAPAANSYGTQRLGTQQGLDIGNLEASLGGTIGSTAYSNALAARDYGQQSTLANQIAQLNKPSLLQQIFGGIGAIGKPLSAFAGAGGFRNSGGGGADGVGSTTGSMSPSLSYIPGGGYSQYMRGGY